MGGHTGEYEQTAWPQAHGEGDVPPPTQNVEQIVLNTHLKVIKATLNIISYIKFHLLACSLLLLQYSTPSIIRTSLIRTLDYPNYQINDIHSICGVHQIEITSPPIENILP